MVENCDRCDTSFKSAKTLRHHRKASKKCLKYQTVLFTCKLCFYQTEGLRRIEEHIKECEVPDPLRDSNVEIARITKELAEERTKVKILFSIISSVSPIPLDDLISEQEGGIHLFGLTSESKIYLHQNISNQVVDVPPIVKVENKGEPTSGRQNKVIRKYRRIKKIITNPEPDKKQVTITIDKVDELKKKETSEHLCGHTISELKELCRAIMEQIKVSRLYGKFLTKLRSTRSKLLGPLTVEEYCKILDEHVEILSPIFQDKHKNPRRVKFNVSRSLTPIDARLLRYDGFTDTQMDADCREKLKRVLKYGRIFPKEFTPYVFNDLGRNFLNYGVAIFTLERLVRWYIINPYGFFNVVYVPLPKSTDSDPYSFYTLSSIKKGKRKWDMNCRLENLVLDLVSFLCPYMVKTFRELYYSLFSDNIYRPNYTSTSAFAAQDCEQLIQNIILISQPIRFSKLLRTLFIKECLHEPTELDIFNLQGDDMLQRKRFQEKEKVEMVDTIGQLFDGISDDDAVNFYKSRGC